MLLLSLSLFSFLFKLPSVSAQTGSNAECLPFYNWTSNAQGETPCQVSASLIAVCNPGGQYFVDALPDSTHYLGPSIDDSTPCQCNTVLYSLMSACGACQGKTYISWSTWTANCATVYTGYPEAIPAGLTIPGWAYLDVQSANTFDQSNARQNANLTASSAIPSSTSTAIASSTHSVTTTSTSSTSAAPSTSTSSAPTQASDDSSGSPSQNTANKVGGAVVGSLLGTMLLVATVFFVLRARRIKRERGVHLESSAGSSIVGGAPEMSTVAPTTALGASPYQLPEAVRISGSTPSSGSLFSSSTPSSVA